MKKVYLLIIIALTLNSVTFSQKMTKEVLLLGAGFGPNIDRIGLSGFNPALRFSGEKGFYEIGPGIITLGGELGFAYQHFTSFGFSANYTHLTFAARSSYFYNFEELLKMPQFNAYAGCSAGLRVVIDHNTNKFGSSYLSQGGAYPHFGAFVGANYFFQKNIAGFVEAGYDVSWGTIGLNFIL